MMQAAVLGVAVSVILACWVSTWGSKRSYELERQDKSPEEGQYTLQEFHGTMKLLAMSNKLDPAGFNATLSEFAKFNGEIRTVLELGFGRGDFSLLISDQYPDAEILGIDVHQLSVTTALQHKAVVEMEGKKYPNVKFQLRNEVELNEPNKSFDVITTTLMNHHIFPQEAFVDFLRRVSRVGRGAFIFNDLRRSPMCILDTYFVVFVSRYIGLNNLSFLEWLLPTALRNGLIAFKDLLQTDKPGFSLFADGAILSMLKAFTLQEVSSSFREAGYPDSAVKCTPYENKDFHSFCRMICNVDLQWNN